MNFSAKLKAAQQPSYIFNFNIDIPIKYKSSITHRSNPVSPGKSPGKLNQKKYKLSSITPRPTGLSTNATNTKKTNTKSNKKTTKIPKTMKEEFLEKDLHQINNFNFNQQKKPEPSISRKTQKITTNKKSQQQQSCPSRRTVKHPHSNNTNSNHPSTSIITKSNVVRNISILQKLVTDDNNIKYKTDSSEVRNTQNSSFLKLNNFMTKLAIQQQQFKCRNLNTTENQNIIQRMETINEDFDLTEIRSFEEISTQRKEKLNYEYLKEKIFIEASVRKIQRAWRNYQTKKLVNCYSSTISSRFIKNNLVNTARSQPRGLNISKHRKPFHSNQLYPGPKNESVILHGQKLEGLQSDQSSCNDSQSNQRSQHEIQEKEYRPFSKKSSHTTGKIKGKFFENQKIKGYLSPRQSLSKPASPKAIQTRKKNQKIQTKQEEEQQINEKQLIKNQKIRQREQQIEQKLKKFQQQQIRKWQSILDSIKKGKNIEVLLQKSQKYKRQLENNLKQQINFAAINQNRASPILFKSRSSKSSLGSSVNANLIKNNQIESKQQNDLENKINSNERQSQILCSPQNNSNISQRHQQDEQNETAQKRKKKIMFFENQILKIDNQDYSDMSNVSCQSFTNYYVKSTHDEDLEQRQREQNLKLRKKLQLFNTHFLDISSADEGLTDRSLKGLKGNSTDDRRSNINKRLLQNNNQLDNDISQNISQKEQLSSEQGRKNRRPDFKIITNQTKEKTNISKIEELINRKIQYPEEDSSSAESSLEVQRREITPMIRQNFNTLSDSSSNEDIINFEGHQKHFNSPQMLNDPAMTHRDRRLQVPNLKLQNIPKKFTIQSQQKENPNIIINKQLQSVDTNTEEKKQPLVDAFKLQNTKNTKNNVHKSKSIPKISMDQALKICSSLEEQLIYQELLQFSDSNRIVQSIKCLFDSFKKQKKPNQFVIQKPKPEGICTNLESIKDYLQNFVGYIFQNKMTDQIEKSLWTPCGPSPNDLLKYLRKDVEYQNNQNDYIMNIQIFEKHWKYANSNIYFDRKYSEQKTEQQRISYLKGLTRVYFRSIYDAFNQSLQFQRVHGLTGRPYPWSRKMSRLQKKTLKLAFQQAYRRILKISVVYYGVHFDDKSHLFNEQDIKELQEQRLLTLLMMELQEEEYRWAFIEDELSEVKYDVAVMVEQLVLDEFLQEFRQIKIKQNS